MASLSFPKYQGNERALEGLDAGVEEITGRPITAVAA